MLSFSLCSFMWWQTSVSGVRQAWHLAEGTHHTRRTTPMRTYSHAMFPGPPNNSTHNTTHTHISTTTLSYIEQLRTTEYCCRHVVDDVVSCNFTQPQNVICFNEFCVRNRIVRESRMGCISLFDCVNENAQQITLANIPDMRGQNTVHM